MKEIKLTQGKTAKVDDEDYEWLSQWKWYYAKGYAARYDITKSSKTLYMHREIMKCPDNIQVDHINLDRSDNRKENLRTCTNKENTRNSGKQRNNTSGYNGVTFRKDNNKWRARIKVDGKIIHLGDFNEKHSAAEAYDRAAIEYYGNFATTNFKL